MKKTEINFNELLLEENKNNRQNQNFHIQLVLIGFLNNQKCFTIRREGVIDFVESD